MSDVTRILDGVALAALDRAVYRSTGFLPMPYLRTLDALHLEAAMRLDASAVLTYDRRLGEAARLGFSRAIVPLLAPEAPVGFQLERVGTLGEAIDLLGLRAPPIHERR